MFLSPLFLIGGAIAASAPIVLHLLQRRRQATVAFPTLRFLQMAEQQSSRRMRMENLLLWFLRTTIMALLGVAFAMPVIRTRGLAWLGRAPRDVAIVVDASYSMGYQIGRETAWDRALETASTIILGLDDKDRYCLYLAREQPEPLIAEPVGSREQGLQLLKAVSLKTSGSRLAPTVQAARAVLDRGQKGREQELYILTDGQAMAWQQPRDDGDADPGEEDTPQRTPFVALLGAPSPANASPESVTLNPPIVVRQAPARIQVRTIHNGPDRESTLRLFVADQEIGRRPLSLGSGDGNTVEFTLPPQPPGVYPARVETPDDALLEDNAFHFLVRVRDQLPLLCVGSEEDTLYVRTALRTALAGGPGTEPTRVDANELANRSLHEMAVIFLCNALPLSGQSLTPLEQYVREGGVLVVFPGDRAAPSDYQPWSVLPGTDAGVVDVPALERGRTLSWPATDHDLLRPFLRELAPPRVTVRRSLTWNGQSGDTRTLISQGPDQPFLSERSVGEGKVLMFAVTADRIWSDFPLSPFYLPLLAQIVDYSAGIGIVAPFIWTTGSIPLTQVVPGATRTTVLLDPQGRRLPVSSAVIDGSTQLRVEGLTTPGVYQVEGQGPALAANLFRQESDLTPVDEKLLGRVLGSPGPYIARDAETLQRLVEEHRIGRTYGEPLLWIVFVLAGIEFVYANRLARQ